VFILTDNGQFYAADKFLVAYKASLECRIQEAGFLSRCKWDDLTR
jgi:hypothetical protein